MRTNEIRTQHFENAEVSFIYRKARTEHKRLSLIRAIVIAWKSLPQLRPPFTWLSNRSTIFWCTGSSIVARLMWFWFCFVLWSQSKKATHTHINRPILDWYQFVSVFLLLSFYSKLNIKQYIYIFIRIYNSHSIAHNALQLINKSVHKLLPYLLSFVDIVIRINDACVACAISLFVFYFYLLLFKSPIESIHLDKMVYLVKTKYFHVKKAHIMDSTSPLRILYFIFHEAFEIRARERQSHWQRLFKWLHILV